MTKPRFTAFAMAAALALSAAAQAPVPLDQHLLQPLTFRNLGPFWLGARVSDIAVPAAPGLGVKLNREKLNEYSDMFKRLGPYPYDQDPLRPGWTPTVPNTRWADPADDRIPNIKF